MKRVHIFYYNKTRNDGTAFYAWNALRKLSTGKANYVENGRPHFDLHFYLPPDGKFAPKSELPRADFNLYVDWGEDCSIFGGCDYVPPSPNAVWWVDTHLGKEYRIKRALQFDKVYLAQLNDVETFKKAGCKDVEWLPLAAEPDLWKPIPTVKHYDVCFIGFLNCEKRIDYLDTLFKAFPDFFYAVRFFEAANEKFNESKMLFNISIRDDVNMRLFETISTGVPLITNRIENNGLEVLFTEGEHYLAYETPEEMVGKIRAHLAKYDSAQKIGIAGREHLLKNHTYEHRMKTVLEKAGIL